MNPLRANRTSRFWIRVVIIGTISAALWFIILHTWFRGPWGSAVQDAIHREWPVSTAAAEGIDADKLAELVRRIRAEEYAPRLQALLIVRHGRLVTEEYFHGWGPEMLHTLQSVTKSFTSALVGIALARGEFNRLDERVLDFFPDGDAIAARDERKADLRVRDVLTMRTGIEYDKNSSAIRDLWLNLLPWGRDTRYLRRPMIADPGSRFNYDNEAALLISSLLERWTRMHVKEYAERHLFAPLGIDRQSWRATLSGLTHTGGGLSLTARDAARFGQLYLQGGRWGGLQIVPEDWVQESLQRHVTFAAEGRGVIGYGYYWWVLSDGVYAAIGRWGQYLIIVPDRDLVVTIFSRPFTRPEQDKALEMLYDSILPAVLN